MVRSRHASARVSFYLYTKAIAEPCFCFNLFVARPYLSISTSLITEGYVPCVSLEIDPFPAHLTANDKK
jgi:hypothetical protein